VQSIYHESETCLYVVCLAKCMCVVVVRE